MGITVKEALLLPPLNKTHLLAGENGLDNIIESVTVVDAPDQAKWLKGNELVLTTAYMLESEVDIENTIRDYAKANIAAFGIKLGRFIHEMPESALRAANYLGLPVFNMPFDCTYVDIIRPILSNILNKKTLMLEYSEQVYLNTMETVLKGGSLASLAQKLSHRINASIAIFSINDKVLKICNPQEGIIDNKRLIDAIHKKRIVEDFFSRNTNININLSGDGLLNILKKEVIDVDGYKCNVITMPITNGKEVYGLLVAIKNCVHFNELETIAMKYTSMALAVEILQENALINLQYKHKINFINDLLEGRFNSDVGMIIRGEYWGWNLGRKFAVVVLDIDSLQKYYIKYNRNEIVVIRLKEKLLNTTNRLLLKYNSVICDISDTIVVLLPVNENNKESKEEKTELLRVVSKFRDKLYKEVSDVTVTIGIGRSYEELKDLKFSYIEAKDAIKIGRQYKGSNNVYHFEDLGVERIISNCKNKDVLDSFLTDTVMPIIMYDKENNSNLIDVLKHYYLCNCNIRDTAKALYMHENTIRNKLKKISILSGIDFNDIESVLNMFIGLKIYLLM